MSIDGGIRGFGNGGVSTRGGASIRMNFTKDNNENLNTMVTGGF